MFIATIVPLTWKTFSRTRAGIDAAQTTLMTTAATEKLSRSTGFMVNRTTHNLSETLNQEFTMASSWSNLEQMEPDAGSNIL